jgi:putative sterol carrier protein
VAEQHPFLSPEWMDAAKRIRDELPHPDVPAVGLMKMNLVVTQSPFEGGDVKAHVDTSDGEIIVEHDHLPDPDLTVTVDYETARALFVEMDVNAALQAFMAGKVKVQGDITKLMALGATPPEPDPKAEAIGRAVRDITAP